MIYKYQYLVPVANKWKRCIITYSITSCNQRAWPLISKAQINVTNKYVATKGMLITEPRAVCCYWTDPCDLQRAVSHSCLIPIVNIVLVTILFTEYVHTCVCACMFIVGNAVLSASHQEMAKLKCAERNLHLFQMEENSNAYACLTIRCIPVRHFNYNPLLYKWESIKHLVFECVYRLQHVSGPFVRVLLT